MDPTTIHHDFDGYGAHPLSQGERLIRERMLECLNGLRERNELCLSRAREEGREKLMSQIMTVKRRLERISEDIRESGSGMQYRLERISAGDERALRQKDQRIADIIAGCSGIIDALSCSETDMHIIDRYSRIMSDLGEVENLFHERWKLLKKMQLYG